MEECIFGYIALHIEYRFNKILLLRSYFLTFWTAGKNVQSVWQSTKKQGKLSDEMRLKMPGIRANYNNSHSLHQEHQRNKQQEK